MAAALAAMAAMAARMVVEAMVMAAAATAAVAMVMAAAARESRGRWCTCLVLWEVVRVHVRVQSDRSHRCMC